MNTRLVEVAEEEDEVAAVDDSAMKDKDGEPRK